VVMSNNKPESKKKRDEELYDLSKDQKSEVLQLARQAIKNRVTQSPETTGGQVDESLRQPAAVFVTLWQETGDIEDTDSKSLRGCIGRLQPDYPLYLAVRNAAVSAATRDPRFPPVAPEELESLTIEVALLSPLEIVNDLHDIVIGRDGLVIEAYGRRGLLLPKVATRMGWGREEFLRNVCLKAGLPPDTWPAGGTLYKFSTTVFQE
jgi:AmmeMemoRadiSam system protein A